METARGELCDSAGVEDLVEDAVGDVDGADGHEGSGVGFVSAFEDGGGAVVVGDGDDRGEGELRAVAVEVEGREGVGIEGGVFADRGGRDGVVAVGAEHVGAGSGGVVPVADAGHHPCGRDIDEDRVVVGRSGRREDADDVELDGVRRGEVEEALGVGNEGVAYFEVEGLRCGGADDTVAEERG